MIKRLLHTFAHWTGQNYGEIETWYEGETLMVGFRCSTCGKLEGVDIARTATTSAKHGLVGLREV